MRRDWVFSGSLDEMTSPVRLEASGISKSFGDRGVLVDVSIDVAPGEFVAIMGASGSGKSTLLYALAGLQRPDEGNVSWGSTSVWQLKESALTRTRRETCGFVFQFAAFLQDLTVAENVGLPLVLAGQRVGRSRELALVVLDKFGLAGLGNAFPDKLSGGELQRASIARALVHQPSLMFADEPTGSLDEVNTEMVVKMLASAARSAGVGVVVVTHDSAVGGAADRILHLRHGEILELPGDAA